MATVALHSKEGLWVMVPTILASSMAFIDATALNVVLPALQHNLHASAADLFWVLNAYLLMLAALILIGGSMGDKFGRKKVFMIGIFIFILGSAACGVAANALLLIVCRVLQGLGGAFMIPGSLSLISSSINEKERGSAIGTWSAVTTLVTMGGPILGGALADAGLWRYIFFINIPIGIAALWFLWKKVEESWDPEMQNEKLDFAGALLIILGMTLLTFGCLRIPALGLGSFQVYGSIIAGIILLIVFIIAESKSRHPMMPLSLFNNPVFAGANLLTFFLYAGLSAAMLFLSLDMVQVQGYTQLQSGLAFLPFTILMIFIARLAGSLSDKYGATLFLVAGPCLTGVGFLLLSFIGQTDGFDHYWGSFFPGILVLGLGMSFTVAPLTATVMGAVGNHHTGTASGINNALTRVAGVFANAIFGSLAVLFFSASLQKQVAPLALEPQQQQAVMAQAKNLGNATVPGSIAAANRNNISTAYHTGFIVAYKKILRIAAGLACLGGMIILVFPAPAGGKKETTDQA